MAKHTPFPWTWDGRDLWHFGAGYDDEHDPHRYTGISTNKQLDDSPVLEANKAMILALPDLLAACEAARDDISSGLPPSSEVFDALQAAIVKAKGGG